MTENLPTLDVADLPSDHPCAGREKEIDALRECGRLFHQRGWSVGTSSNYSAVLGTDPLDLIVTASGKDKGRLGRTDFVRVGPNGVPSSEGQPKSSAETMLHVVLAEASKAGDADEVGCILHTHSIWGTLLSDYFFSNGGFAIEGYEMLKGLEGVGTHERRQWVSIFENTQDIPSLAKDVELKLADTKNPLNHGFLIRRHGLYTWGKDVFAARRHIEIFEFLFEVVARKIMLPTK